MQHSNNFANFKKNEKVFYFNVLNQSFFSAQNVPKGSNETKKARKALLNFQLNSIQTCKRSKQYAINKIPCAIPTI